MTRTWRAHGLCKDDSGRLTRVFFSERPRDISRAKHICASCPVLLPCLEMALDRREPWGVWGGQVFRDGTILPIKRGRGRPPRHPRPEDEFPDVPIPEPLRERVAVRTA
jgi:WhiB family transcriptional regulator, redox-sensing transcriptional regulator